VIATVALRDERALFVLVPGIGPVELEAGGSGVPAREVQGRARERLTAHGPVEAGQTGGPQGVQRPAQAVVMARHGVHRALADHLPIVVRHRLRDAGSGLLAGENG
jgi:hypothetical protein